MVLPGSSISSQDPFRLMVADLKPFLISDTTELLDWTIFSFCRAVQYVRFGSVPLL